MIGGLVGSRPARLAFLLAALGSVLAAAALVIAVDGDELVAGVEFAVSDLLGLALIAASMTIAFSMRALAWCRVLPGLGFSHALAAVHVALGANHVLPFRLGEPLRIASVVRRSNVGLAPVASTTVMLRSADILSLALLGVVAAPALVSKHLGFRGALLLAVVAAVGLAAAVFVVTRLTESDGSGTPARLPDLVTLLLVSCAWLAEAVVVWRVMTWFGIDLGPREAMTVLAAAVVVQAVAVTPGGLGTYEAAGTAALVAIGVPATSALTAVVVLHAVKTLYSLVAGTVGVFVPQPSLLGRLRLDPVPSRPSTSLPQEGPVVLFLPAFNEAERLAPVVEAAPRSINGHPVEVVVIDDASTDDSAAVARAAGARVVAHRHNRGLGAAVRTGFQHARDRGAIAAAFCDADGEYDPSELERLVSPILEGRAHYVVGSRFEGEIRRMLPHRRIGNLTLTRWVRFVTRVRVTDGQSGYRALSAQALAEVEIAHDYNYAQVLTIDMVGKGFGYQEVPINYEFRRSGRSFVRLGRYLRHVVPAVWRQLNETRPSSAFEKSNLSTKENETCFTDSGLV